MKTRTQLFIMLFLLTASAVFVSSFSLHAQSVCHPKIGETTTSPDGSIRLTIVAQKHNFSSPVPRDTDIRSPKSVNVHPNGKKFYVNSLEGYATICYDVATTQKLAVIPHSFSEKDAQLWAKPSGLWNFTHYTTNLNTFTGKPVESTFSHNGKYLWVPYYRRNYDINAQDPSAVAVIDTDKDQIVRLFETGPLPKMITTSHNGQFIAISHWGNNTVGLLDISGDDINDWHYVNKFVVDYELPLNYSLHSSVNRDVNSGYCLRGTVFTPGDRYLLVGCMGNGGGIAVIDIQQKKYLGRIKGMKSNVRHLAIKNGWLYLSINNSGYVQRIPLATFITAAQQLDGGTFTLEGWQSCKVGGGARTLELSPDGRFIYVACNTASRLCVVDTRSFEMIAQIPVDSYPVGLDVSPDGKRIFVTSQGRKGNGGNAVNIYQVEVN